MLYKTREPIKGTIGGILQMMRENRGLNLSEMAGMMGVSIPTVYRIETNKAQLTMGWIVALAKVHGLSPAKFVELLQKAAARDVMSQDRWHKKPAKP